MRFLPATIATALAVTASCASFAADTSAAKIALSNNFAGNSWIKQLFFCKFHELVLRRCAHAAVQGFMVR